MSALCAENSLPIITPVNPQNDLLVLDALLGFFGIPPVVFAVSHLVLLAG